MISDRERQYMRLAVEESRKGIQAGDGGPFGCVVVKNDTIIAAAHNMVQAHNDPTAHAEIQAIRMACEVLNHFQLDGCEMYCSCEPCPMCFGAIYWARPTKVYYANTKKEASSIGFDDQFIYDEIEHAPEKRRITMIHLVDDEAVKVMQEWHEKGDKTLY